MRLRIVLASLAIAAALVGTAVADSGPTAVSAGKLDKAAKQAKQAKKKAKKALKTAKAAEQEPGTQGEKGATGGQGAAGEEGDPGADAASIFTAKISGLEDVPADEFGAVSGQSTSTDLEAAVITLAPNVEMTVRDLAVIVSAPPDASEGHVFTIRDDGDDTDVFCSIDNGETECDSGALTDTIAAGSELSISIVTTGAPPSAFAILGFRATTP